LPSPLWRIVVAGGGVILWVKRKSRLAGMRAAILEQNQKQGIPSPRPEHKAKLLALGILSGNGPNLLAEMREHPG
jgi:hypothetical protein